MGKDSVFNSLLKLFTGIGSGVKNIALQTWITAKATATTPGGFRILDENDNEVYVADSSSAVCIGGLGTKGSLLVNDQASRTVFHFNSDWYYDPLDVHTARLIWARKASTEISASSIRTEPLPFRSRVLGRPCTSAEN